MSHYRVGILTSGGDCPGLNAVLWAAATSASTLGWEMLGFCDGYEGLLCPVRYRLLDQQNTGGIMALGGTIIGTTNKGRFVAKVGAGDVARIPDEIINETKETLEGLGVNALICVGGDGSLSTAQQLFEAGIPVVGVPKTIDNDLSATAVTFGFNSAVACVSDALDRLHTTAVSHRRVMVVEVMGRHTGWIALHGGLAGGANMILLPEVPFHYDKVVEFINKHFDNGNRAAIVVVAEGAFPKDGGFVSKASGHPGEVKMGGIASQVADYIGKHTQHETRTVVLGHLQRGGPPTTLDRILGMRFGVGAIKLIQEKKFGHMVSYQNYEIGSVPIPEAVGQLKRVQPDSQMLQAARTIGISFGD